MTRVSVLSGDTTHVRADALITAINPGGMWFGGIDGVIQRVAGDQFHAQARNAMPLEDGQTIVARKQYDHRGRFRDVLFVVDGLARPLNTIVYNALCGAAEAGFESVVLPTIRMGVMLGVVEKTKQQAIQEMAEATKVFLRERLTSPITSITFVVYNDVETAVALGRELGC